MKRILRPLLIVGGCLALAAVLLVGITNLVVIVSTQNAVLTAEEAEHLQDIDCVLVLGCGVREDGSPTSMLEDRLLCSVELYRRGVAPKLLMSGDHGQPDYNEVGTMKAYAVASGIPDEDVFMDHAGFSTYESLYRAKAVFGAKRIVIVTQRYHLSRALYIAKALGIEAYGVASDPRAYAGQFGRDVREVLARTKDVAYAAWKPEPTYLGDPIPVSGNGNLTNDT